jgi:hypothetical protein
MNPVLSNDYIVEISCVKEVMGSAAMVAQAAQEGEMESD